MRRAHLALAVGAALVIAAAGAHPLLADGEGGVSFTPHETYDMMRQQEREQYASVEREIARFRAVYLHSARLRCWLDKCWRPARIAERERRKEDVARLFLMGVGVFGLGVVPADRMPGSTAGSAPATDAVDREGK